MQLVDEVHIECIWIAVICGTGACVIYLQKLDGRIRLGKSGGPLIDHCWSVGIKKPGQLHNMCGPESRGFDRCLEDNLKTTDPTSRLRGPAGMLSESFTRGLWIWTAELVMILFLEMTKAVCDAFADNVFKKDGREISRFGPTLAYPESVDVLLFVNVWVFRYGFLVYFHASKLVSLLKV